MKYRGLVIALLPVFAACAPTPVDKNTRQAAGLAEIACLGAVSTQSGSANVAVVDAQFAQSGTSVTLYDADSETNWSCVATADGQVQSVSQG